MTTIHASAPTALPLALTMAQAPAELRRRHRRTTRTHLLTLQRRVRANMSGRSGVTYTPLEGSSSSVSFYSDGGAFVPSGGKSGEIGPRVQSGDTRRHVQVSPIRENGGFIWGEVATSDVHAVRLELGYTGTDSRGRSFDTPPYPAWRPAADATVPEYQDAIVADYVEVERMIGGGR